MILDTDSSLEKEENQGTLPEQMLQIQLQEGTGHSRHATESGSAACCP